MGRRHSLGVAGALPVVLLALVLVAAGCSSSDDDDVSATEAVTGFEAKPTISLVVNDWTASAINVAVAEQLIERRLGYPVVGARVDDMDDVYDSLADGELDAVLEVWPSNMTDRHRAFFDRGDVADIGPLGPTGKVGWFVPRYVVEDHPELATWEGLTDPDIVELFATPETAPRGRFLGTNPDYRQFDAEIIASLDLSLEVVFSGSEAETLAELEASHAGGEPILVYWWTPTAAVAAYDLVNVALPPSTDTCREAANGGGGAVDCDYPTDELFKAVSPALAAKAPDVAAFLAGFALSTDDQLAMLRAVELDGLSIDAAAAAWIEANGDTWRAWLADG